MRWEYVFVVGNAALVSASLLLMRYGGKDLDMTQGISHIFAHGRIWILGMLLGWISGFLFSFVLTRVSVTVASSLYVPLVYTIAFWGGVLFLKEPVDVYKVFASILILSGLIVFFKSGS